MEGAGTRTTTAVSSRLEGRTKTRDKEGEKTSLTGRSVSRVLRGLGIVAAVLFCLIITASAMGYNPVQAFFIWADGVVQIYSNPSGKMELPESSTSDYISLSQALIENGLDDAGCPTWIPKDYEILSVDAAFAGNIDKYSAVYYSQRGEILIRVMKFCDGNWNIIDERDDGGRMETINGLECHIISNMEQCKAGWVIGSCSYLISGQITEDELITMIESIKQGEK